MPKTHPEGPEDGGGSDEDKQHREQHVQSPVDHLQQPCAQLNTSQQLSVSSAGARTPIPSPSYSFWRAFRWRSE